MKEATLKRKIAEINKKIGVAKIVWALGTHCDDISKYKNIKKEKKVLWEDMREILICVAMLISNDNIRGVLKLSLQSLVKADLENKKEEVKEKNKKDKD